MLLFALLYRSFKKNQQQHNTLIESQKALRKSEQQHRTLVASMSDILFVLDEDDRFVETYHQPDAPMAFNPKEFIGSKIQEIMPPEVVSQYESLVLQVRKSGETQRHEYPLNINGNTRWFSSTLDQHKKNKQIIANIRDITLRKQAEIELQQMFDISPDLLCTVDSDTGYFTKLNPAWSRILGFSLEELYAKPLMEFIHPEDRESTAKEIDKQLAGQRTGSFENRYRTINGSYRWLSWRAAPTNDSVLFATARDITYEKHRRLKERSTLVRERREAEVVSTIATSPALAQGNFTKICRELTESAAEALGPIRAGVWLYEQNASMLVNQDTYDARDHVHFRGQSLHESRCPQLFLSLNNHKYIAVEEAWADDRTSQLQPMYLKPNNILSILMAVIHSGEKILGVLSLEHTQEIHQWADDEITFAIQLSDQIAITLSNQEKHEAQVALQRSEREYESLFNSIQDAIVVADMNRQLMDCNAAFTELFGYAKEEIIRQPTNIIYPDHDKYIESEQILEKRMDDPTQPTITEFKTKSGELFLGEVVSFFLRDSENERRGFIGIIRDVTFRERQIEQQQRYLQAMSQVGEAVVITDPEGRIEYVNPAFTEITGYSPEEVIGRNPHILNSGKHSQEFYQELWDTIQSGESWSGQFVNKRKDGEFYTEDAVISPVKDSRGHIINYVAVKRDITEQLQLEEELRQSQKMEAVGQLAGGIAHDFNNLLTIINGYTSILSSQPLPDETQALVSSIEHAGQRAAELTNQLLAFSRKQKLEPQTIYPDKLIKKIVPMLNRLLAEDIDIRIETNANETQIMVDPGQLEQVILNLALNARDAMKKGGRLNITSDVSTYLELPLLMQEEFKTDSADYYCLTVSDTGTGMKTELLEKIFEPFFTTKPEGQGTGLGLSTVYGIVKQSGGAIDVESQPGEGTTFTLYFPESSAVRVVQKKETHPEDVDLRAREILVVDDDPGILKYIRYVLERGGMNVHTSERASDALEFLRSTKSAIDVLLCDVILEDENGSVLAEKCKSIHQGLQVILMSGYTDDRTLEYLLEGHSISLRKPFEKEELVKSIQSALE